MSSYKWFDLLADAVPEFQLGLVRWIHHLETWREADAMSARIVLGYADRCEIFLLAKNVAWLAPLRPADAPGVLPYAPYGVGEFAIADLDDGGVMIADELGDLRVQAGSIMIEQIKPIGN